MPVVGQASRELDAELTSLGLQPTPSRAACRRRAPKMRLFRPPRGVARAPRLAQHGIRLTPRAVASGALVAGAPVAFQLRFLCRPPRREASSEVTE